jgi:hypothetical protein
MAPHRCRAQPIAATATRAAPSGLERNAEWREAIGVE